MGFRRKPAAVVTGPLGEGGLNLYADCAAAASVFPGDFKFTITSPYMLSRSLLDRHYGDFEALTLAIAEVLAAQVRDLPCACVQVDEANIPGNPADAPLAARVNIVVLDQIKTPAGCPSLLRQLWRPDDTEGALGRAHRFSEFVEYGSSGA